jgi:hypothetical protein
MTGDFYKMLVEQVEKTSQRGRWILSISIIISLSQLGAAFNFTFGYLRIFTEYLIFDAPAWPTSSTPLSELQKELVKNWVDQLTININLIGAHFSVADANIIGGFALFIITVWLFYAARRENHLIGRACKIAESETKEYKSYLFFGICSTQLFGALSSNDAPIASLNQNQQKTVTGIRWLVTVLFYLPAITIASNITTDLLSVFRLHAVFRGSRQTLFEFLSDKKMFAPMLPHIITPILVQLVILWFTIKLVKSIVSYQQGTVSLLQELERKEWNLRPEVVTQA